MNIEDRRIRMVMLDIDGTIVNSSKSRTMTAELCEVIWQVVENGIYVGLASGRNYGHVMSLIRGSGFTGPFICNNGAYIVWEDEVYRERLLPDTVIEAAWAQVRSLKCYVEFSGRNVMHTCVVPGYTGPTFPKVGEDEYLDEMEYSQVDFEKIRRDSISKITIVVDTKEKAEEVTKFWTEGSLKDLVSLSRSFWFCLELTQKGVCKGEGLKEIAGQMGIPMSEVLAIGDGDNDVEMLQAAGISFAMENASYAALAAAKYRTASVEEDGARQVLEKYLLKRK
ncbi:HAD family hydrolase [Roseburia hominis]